MLDKHAIARNLSPETETSYVASSVRTFTDNAAFVRFKTYQQAKYHVPKLIFLFVAEYFHFILVIQIHVLECLFRRHYFYLDFPLEQEKYQVNVNS